MCRTWEQGVAEPSDTLRLLPGFDPWVLGPGTADTRIVAAGWRALATRGANLVVWRRVVSGTWRAQRREVAVSWFDEAGAAPADAIEDEVRWLAGVRGEELRALVIRA